MKRIPGVATMIVASALALGIALVSVVGAAPPPSASPAAATHPIDRNLSAGIGRVAVAPRMSMPVRSAQAARLRLVTPLTLSESAGHAGTPLYASARVKNISAAPLRMRYLRAAGRGPDVPDWDCGSRRWDNCGADFEAIENVDLQPGEELDYRQLRVPAVPGAYFAEMVYQDAESLNWLGATSSNRVRYRVSGGDLALTSRLTLTPAEPRPGQPAVATARVRNIGDEALPIRLLAAVGRGPECDDWSCNDWDWTRVADFTPAEDLVLQPGEEYTYLGLTGGRPRGAGYFAEIAYRRPDVDAWRFGLAGGNRIIYAAACDGRCDMVLRLHRDVVGREPDAATLRTLYDAPLDEAQLRGLLCGRADRRAAACRQPALAVVERLVAFLPVTVRPAPAR